ncbi:MAG TPA: DNRLRE domain-containing protein, partial [Roseiflexaceae bacterium]|nr:DNRLRE domain-containing protein [Roseiflexaceae bacterium]
VSASKAGYTTAVNVGAIVTFGTYTAIDFALDSSNPPITLSPLGDVYTSSTAPTQNFGAATDLRSVTGTGTNLKSDAFVQFDVSGLTRPVRSAKLRLYVTNASNQGVGVYSVSNNYKDTDTPWTELNLNYNNAPAIGATPLSSVGIVPVNTWAEFDVTAALNGNGVYSFGLRAPSTNDVRYSSKQAASNQPQLIIQQAAPPALEVFAPAKGPAGVEVTITGVGFTGATGVTFGNVPAAAFSVDTDTQIRAIVPAGAASGKIAVLTSSGTATSLASFEVIATPVVTMLKPTWGNVGTEVTITGTGLGSATSVKFGDLSASSFTIDSDTQIRAIVPAGASSGTVTVVTGTGTAISAASFVVTPATAPSHWVYMPQLLGGAANGAGARTEARRTYTAQTIGWSDSANDSWFICDLERW